MDGMMAGMMGLMHGWGLLVLLLLIGILAALIVLIARGSPRSHAPKILAAATAGLLLSACSRSADDPRGGSGTGPPPKTTGSPGPVQYPIRGTVEAVATDGQAVTLDHEDVPGLMAGMTMRFKIADPSMATNLKAGDRVTGTLEVRGNDYVIVALRNQ